MKKHDDLHDGKLKISMNRIPAAIQLAQSLGESKSKRKSKKEAFLATLKAKEQVKLDVFTHKKHSPI